MNDKKINPNKTLEEIILCIIFETYFTAIFVHGLLEKKKGLQKIVDLVTKKNLLNYFLLKKINYIKYSPSA